MHIKKFSYKKIIDKKGSLLPISFKEMLNFKVKRIFFISGKKNIIRGDHAHKKCYQALFQVEGKSKINLYSKSKKKEIFLNEKKNIGIIIPPLVWVKIKFLSKKNLILVFCSEEYDQKDYIYNFKDISK